MNNKMFIYVRHDQLIDDIGRSEYQDDNVKIFAPKWVESCVDKLDKQINKTIELNIVDKTSKSTIIKLSQKLTLKDLIILSRKNPSNVTGRIEKDDYQNLATDPAIIYSIKDLVRQLIIIGWDETVSNGGYPRPEAVKQKEPVIIVDLIGLQFQQTYNTGRLVLIGDKLPNGILDGIIFEHNVGEPKKSYQDVKNDQSGRYVKFNKLFFDTYAYEMFVANDIVLTCVELNQFTDKFVKLKFLKYGSGYFASSFRSIIEDHISKGVAIGMRRFLETNINKIIKLFEFPYFSQDDEIVSICKKFNVTCKFTRDDALKHTDAGLVTATTNCADPHAMTGNELGYSSVDAAIAENLKSKANKFSPLINL